MANIVEINQPSLSDCELNLLAYGFVELIKKYYENPKNIKKFEKWQKLKEKRKDEQL